MAIEFEEVKGALRRPIGIRAGEPKMVVNRVAGPTSYAAGGFDVTVSELGEVIAGFVIAGGGYLAEIDWANSSKNKLRVKAYYFDYDAAGDGAAIEVADGTDLSGVYFTIVAFGW